MFAYLGEERELDVAVPEKILIIVPAYNEEENISGVIESLKKEMPAADIIVVNDASTDETKKVASKSKNVVVASLPVNLGIGGAVQTGFKYAVAHRYDITLQFDGDGQHLASEINTLIMPIQENRADVVIGSRFLKKEYKGFRSTFARRIGIIIFGVINSLLIRQKITDNTSGFRAYNRDATALLAKYYSTDFPEPEAVIMLGKNKFRILEVFTEMNPRKKGISSISSGDSFYYMIKVLLAVFINAIRSPVSKR